MPVTIQFRFSWSAERLGTCLYHFGIWIHIFLIFKQWWKKRAEILRVKLFITVFLKAERRIFFVRIWPKTDKKEWPETQCRASKWKISVQWFSNFSYHDSRNFVHSNFSKKTLHLLRYNNSNFWTEFNEPPSQMVPICYYSILYNN